jgi:hypothetical protein
VLHHERGVERNFAFLSVPWYMSPNKDFYVIDRGGESHGGCDRTSTISERFIGCNVDLLHAFFPMCRVFGDLQQHSRQERVATYF